MNRGGGWKGGQGGRDGQRGGGTRDRQDGQRSPSIRFPSDHAGRSDERGAAPRFPSDSVKGKHDIGYSGRDENRDTRSPGRDSLGSRELGGRDAQRGPRNPARDDSRGRSRRDDGFSDDHRRDEVRSEGRREDNRRNDGPSRQADPASRSQESGGPRGGQDHSGERGAENRSARGGDESRPQGRGERGSERTGGRGGRGERPADPMSGRPGRPQGGAGGSSRPHSFGSQNGRRYQRHGHRRDAALLETAQLDAAFDAVAVEAGDVSHIDPFELFCAYHLGLGRDGSVRSPDLNDTARRFGVGPGAIKQALVTFAMDPESLDDTDFDVSLARMDIQVSPPGISKKELARGLFQELIDALGERCPFGDGVRGARPADSREPLDGEVASE